MEIKGFNCLRCGRCCVEILRNTHGVTVGLYLRHSETKLFDSYPSAVVPYAGIARNGSSEPDEIICYQMVQEPCPLYDIDAKRCREYDSRPVACRAYPIGLNGGRGLTIEDNCGWLAANKNKIKYGRTRIDAEGEIRYALEIHTDFAMYARAITKNAVVMIYDVETRKWTAVRL